MIFFVLKMHKPYRTLGPLTWCCHSDAALEDIGFFPDPSFWVAGDGDATDVSPVALQAFSVLRRCAETQRAELASDGGDGCFPCGP